ncbi:hypothetical protein SDC9_90548 [bioreactor metagenome]|uniref:Uncharacterized protein n=1 Tax=bioreactor metagenome TaxID=1076179 RepID=A0A644ZVF5_9ZZZZ
MAVSHPIDDCAVIVFGRQIIAHYGCFNVFLQTLDDLRRCLYVQIRNRKRKNILSHIRIASVHGCPFFGPCIAPIDGCFEIILHLFILPTFYLLFILSLVFTIATPNQILIQRKWRIHFGDSPFFSHTIKDSPFSFFSSAL